MTNDYETGAAGIEGCRFRPWQLLVIGDGCGHLTARTIARLTHILELFPSVSHLIVETRQGLCQVSRDFPSGYTGDADKTLASIFQDDPSVTGIAFPATQTQPGHTATSDDPHWSSKGKTSADIMAASRRGEITHQEALERLKRVHGRDPA